jgi:hypothetical protein
MAACHSFFVTDITQYGVAWVLKCDFFFNAALSRLAPLLTNGPLTGS